MLLCMVLKNIFCHYVCMTWHLLWKKKKIQHIGAVYTTCLYWNYVVLPTNIPFEKRTKHIQYVLLQHGRQPYNLLLLLYMYAFSTTAYMDSWLHASRYLLSFYLFIFDWCEQLPAAFSACCFCLFWMAWYTVGTLEGIVVSRIYLLHLFININNIEMDLFSLLLLFYSFTLFSLFLFFFSLFSLFLLLLDLFNEAKPSIRPGIPGRCWWCSGRGRRFSWSSIVGRWTSMADDDVDMTSWPIFMNDERTFLYMAAAYMNGMAAATAAATAYMNDGMAAYRKRTWRHHHGKCRVTWWCMVLVSVLSFTFLPFAFLPFAFLPFYHILTESCWCCTVVYIAYSQLVNLDIVHI